MSRVLAAVAWPYANGPRHIGHVSGFGVPSDVFSRYMRMAGHDVLMVSGSDEHGTAIQVKADAEGLTPWQTCLTRRNDRVVEREYRKIRELLYNQGFTISGARNRLDEGAPVESAAVEVPEAGKIPGGLRNELQSIIEMLRL